MLKIRPVIVSIIVAVAGYGAWIAYSEYASVMAAASMVGWLGLLFIISLSLLNYLIRFIRWHWFVGLLGYQVPRWQNFIYYLAGFALTTTPGKAGETIRAVYMKPHGVKVTSCVAAVTAERLSDVLAVLILALAALYHFPQYLWIAAISIFVVVAFIYFVHSRTLQLQFERFIARRKEGPVQRGLMHFIHMIEDMSTLLGYKALIKGLLLGVISWSAEAYGFYYIVKVMGFDEPMLVLVGIYSLSMLAGAISFLPGGLGSAELVMGLMLIAIGVGQSEAVSATVICRIVTLWLAVFIGLIALSYVESRRQNTNSDASYLRSSN